MLMLNEKAVPLAGAATRLEDPCLSRTVPVPIGKAGLRPSSRVCELLLLEHNVPVVVTAELVVVVCGVTVSVLAETQYEYGVPFRPSEIVSCCRRSCSCRPLTH